MPNQDWTSMVAMTTQPFWGWPFSFIPTGQSTSAQSPPGFDSQGNIDPNWAIPANEFNPWDTAWIQGVQVPGKVSINCKKAHRVDKRLSPGFDGANATMLGFDTAEVTMDVMVWSEAQFYQLQAMYLWLQQQIISAKQQPRGNVQAAIEIQHPKLAMLAVQKLYVRELIPPDDTGTPGVLKARVVLEEFNPAQKGSSATINASPPPLQSIPATSFQVPPKAVDPAQGPGALP